MQAKMIERVVADLRAQSCRHDAQGGDAALLDAFLARRDQAAFAALVQRHGPMVLGVCRRILGHVQDSEDAFQAAFWVLARKANTVRPRGHVGNWLYGVAVRTALKARGLRRRRREYQVNAMPPPTVAASENHFDMHTTLDEEIERLPSKYRNAVVLCELEGRGRAEAAAQLRVPEGTLSSRLAYARKLLAKRLQARGAALSAGGLAVAGAAVPQSLLASTLQAAHAAAPSSASVSVLVKGVMTAMLLSKLKQIAVVSLLCALMLGFGLGSHGHWATLDGGEAQPAKHAAQRAPAAQASAPFSEPIQAGKPNAQTMEGIEGLWRLLKIDVRADAVAGAGGEGAGGVGPRGGGSAPRPGPAAGSGSVSPMGGAGAPPHSTAFDGSSAKTLLHITKDQAVYSSRGTRILYQMKTGAGTIDWINTDGDVTVTMLGVYSLVGNELQLCFGPSQVDQKGGPPAATKVARPKSPKEAVEVWTLARQPTRQEIYKRLDQLQGDWIAVSGEHNGEAFLPRELKEVRLAISGDRWNMTAPQQPGQPDAVPRRFFAKPLEFVLDAEGSRNYLVLQNVSKTGDVRVLYELRGGELKICWNTRWPSQGRAFSGPPGLGSGADAGETADTPKELKTPPGSDLVMFVLKRDTMGSDSGMFAAPPGGSASAAPGGQPPGTGEAKLVISVVAVGDLTSGDADKKGTTLIKVITRTIEPSSWDSNGGVGSIEYFPDGKSLVISQTADLQARIMTLLMEMREAKKQQDKK